MNQGFDHLSPLADHRTDVSARHSNRFIQLRAGGRLQGEARTRASSESGLQTQHACSLCSWVSSAAIQTRSRTGITDQVSRCQERTWFSCACKYPEIVEASIGCPGAGSVGVGLNNLSAEGLRWGKRRKSPPLSMKSSISFLQSQQSTPVTSDPRWPTGLDAPGFSDVCLLANHPNRP